MILMIIDLRYNYKSYKYIQQTHLKTPIPPFPPQNRPPQYHPSQLHHHDTHYLSLSVSPIFQQ